MRGTRLGARIVVGALVLVGAAACGGTTAAQAPTAAPSAAATTTAAATTQAAAPATETAASPELAATFPAATEPTCAPAGTGSAQLTTSTGITAVDAVVCDYSSIAPGAKMIYAHWPDAAAAQRWYQDTADLGPRLEAFDKWQVGGVEQGPLYTAQGGAFVYSTGLYEGLPYGWEIQTSTLDESNAVFASVPFTSSAQLGG